ncbi:ABC transporter permease subunit [Streptomyces sp. H10-C2]|uniref:ABC transporter permease subunit n=1 Tax=unclassified Streptomyces TaxID=2593676 RepID=UPI0024B8792C|nr:MULTISPECIES: ABC transporter permease subunit [unclassified Streptomyces]MDJ0341515.1 ABC transporter permease subunit [Streptomyces sp. PH10-H1]MDJ0369172.1 ABC transporter permease subunit [Streptomyces sp. H10-C2]
MTAPVPGAVPGAPYAYAQQQYTSPIPVQTTTLAHALKSEWTKIRSVRSTVWTISVMLAVVIGIGLLVTWAMSRSDYVGAPLLSGGLFGLMLGQLAVVTLGVLVVTSEYSTGMIRTTFTACPSRSRVLTAKVIVFFGLSFVTTTVACGITALINSAALSDQTAPSGAGDDAVMRSSIEAGKVVANGGQWLGATVGAGLFVALLGLLSLAIGTLLRHSAGAITAMMGVVLLPFIMAIFMFADSMHSLREFLIKYSALNGLASMYRIPMDGGTSTGWPGLGLLAVITAIALGGAYAVLAKRDV